jgi:hypothetical protein
MNGPIETWSSAGRTVAGRTTGAVEIHDTIRLQIAVADVAQVDAELQEGLKRAYAQNA